MTRATMTFTVSLLPELFEEIEQVRAIEHRTRPELIREALRCYFALKGERSAPVAELAVHANKA